MQLQNVIKISALLIASLALSGVATLQAETVQGGMATIQSSSTPQQFSASLGKVNSFTLRIIPGYCSKVYIGFSNMNLSTLNGVIKIMYPNCNGGLSDEWSTPPDITGTDSFDTSLIYIAADQGLTAILWQATSTGKTASSMLQPVGPVGPYNDGVTFGGPYNTRPGMYSLEAHIVPGMSGKIWTYLAGNSSNPIKVNYPNNGTVTGNITDGWKYTSSSMYGISNSFDNRATVSGEYMLVTQWGYQ